MILLRKSIIVIGVLSTLTSLSPSLAGNFEVRFRYRDTIWNGDGVVLNPTTPVPETELPPFRCPEAGDIFRSKSPYEVEDGCFYPAPETYIDDSFLSPEDLGSPLNEWCGKVYAGSHAIRATEAVQKAAAAGFDSEWTRRASASRALDVVCSADPDIPPISDDPVLRAGTLKNADMENRSSIYITDWIGSFAEWGFADRQIGGAKSLAPYDHRATDQVFYQDVGVSNDMATAGFPVEVLWIQSAGNTLPQRGGIELAFLDATRTQISAVASTKTSVDRMFVNVERSLSATAPKGTAFVRVKLLFQDGRALIDNVALRLAGVDVSEIAGGFGMPARPQDYLKNAGAEYGPAEWKVLDLFVGNHRKVEGLEDVLGLTGTGHISGAPWPNMTLWQQVWLSDKQRGKPVTFRWQQGSEAPNDSIGTMVGAKFFTRDGNLITDLRGPGRTAIAGFFEPVELKGTVPANAGFMVLEVFAKSPSSRTDNITVDIGGKPYSMINSESAPETVDFCPRYVDTRNGPGDNRWFLSNWMGAASSLSINYLTGETYKSYCVPAGSKHLIGHYTLTTLRAWGGLKYSAYDGQGNLLDEKTSYHSSEDNKTTEVWEKYVLPTGTRMLKTSAIYLPKKFMENSYANYWAVVDGIAELSAIDLIMNGELPGEKGLLRNGGADVGIAHWTPTPFTGGNLATKTTQSMLTAITSVSGGGGGGGSSSTVAISCDILCQIEPDPNKAFYSVDGEGEFYQDVVIDGWNFAEGSDVHLRWKNGVEGGGFLSTSSTTGSGGTSVNTLTLNVLPDKASVGMGLEFFDEGGNSLKKRMQEKSYNESYFLNLSVTRTLDTDLPKGTKRIRVYMTGMKNGMATIDGIELKVNGKNISRMD